MICMNRTIITILLSISVSIPIKIELKFLAPEDPGHFTYFVTLRSDSYVDFDVVIPVKVIL